MKDGKVAQDSDGVIRAQTFRREEAGRWDLRVKSSNADATWKKRKKKSSVTVSSFSGQESLRRNGVAIMGQQKSPKCSTWMQSQKRQNDLCSFPRQTIQYDGNPRLCPNQ